MGGGEWAKMGRQPQAGRAAIRRGDKNGGDKGGMSHLTTFGGGKIAAHPGCR